MRKAFLITMGSKIKEDERTEKAIRSLLKLSENRRCINCNSLGPQYVCSTFWTFVCINCSGIHREFTHRVKSISMAKFTTEEVSSLRAGGNERARQIYFKEWDIKRDVYPDSSNIFKLREFIKSVYVDKRYSGQSNDKLSLHKPAVIEDSSESKKAHTKFFGSRSLHSEENSEIERSISAAGKSGSESLKFYFEEKKHKPQHVMHNPKSRGLPKSPIRFEIVDDRYRDDGSVKRYEARKDLRGASKSLDLSNNKEVPRLPIVRHASELLGDNAPHLRVTNIVKVETEKDPVDNQITAPSHKMENPRSLIDDEPVPEHSDDNMNQTSNETLASPKTTEKPAPNSLEALLFGFSDSSVDINPAANLEIQTMPTTPENVASFVSTPTISHAQFSHAGSLSPTFPVSADNLNTTEVVTPSVTANYQEPSNTCMELSTIDVPNSVHGAGSEQHHQDDTTSSIRKELPEDLFTGGFSFASPQVHGQHHEPGYGMQYYQYPMQTMGANLTYNAKPANPFDLGFDDASPNQAPPQFPSQSPFYAIAQSPSPLALASYHSPGVFMEQQSNVDMSQSFGRQETNGFGADGNTLNVAHTYHQANNGYPTNPNAYISRGNPFE